MNCLICDIAILYRPSWRSLFLNDAETVVCASCKRKFERIDGAVCGKCGLPGEEMCGDCRHWETTEFAGLIESGSSLFQYNDAMQAFLHQYKFLQDVALAHVFGEDLKTAFRKSENVLVPIPMNSKKLKERTFPQVDRLLDAAGLTYSHFLIKSEDVQGTKTKAERMAAKNLFAWNGEKVPKKIVLVDDLYTTGTTMRQAAKAMKDAGTEEIRFLTLIRG
ncbi:ComF family protein [Planococcus shenhongbingii]|uniref:ComF family protein n=1 Tax=Planococcus shenhongbingii TaxID=3058398 RepID=A0ABT8N9S8_9BACL|nr:ComF family protein [Planococcus sp. N017]MDN7244444.1 ComF family protein [Planococcus sp. N017]